MKPSGRIPCLARRLAPFAGAAALAFLLVIPGSDMRWGEYGAAAVVTAAVLTGAVALPWRNWSSWMRVAPALLFLVAVFLLRDAAGGATAGVSILAMLPVFWLAMHGTRGGVPYGGACLPKDTVAFLQFARELGMEHQLLEATISVNRRLAAPTGTAKSNASPNAIIPTHTQ